MVTIATLTEFSSVSRGAWLAFKGRGSSLETDVLNEREDGGRGSCIDGEEVKQENTERQVKEKQRILLES